MFLVALLCAAITSATFFQAALSVMSPFLLAEFGLSRSGLGVAFAVYALTGAACSPPMGALTDRNARRMLLLVFVLSAVALVCAASAPSYGFFVGAAAVGGLALAAGNPVTNALIAELVSVSRRGIAVGVKQSGSPLGLLAGGMVLPHVAVTYGWRWALAAGGLLPLLGFVTTPVLIPKSRGRAIESTVRSPQQIAQARSAIVWLTAIGFGMALGLSAVIAFLPLYATESEGMSATMAGVLAAAMGLAGVVGRILWGWFGSRFSRYSTALLIASGISVAATAAIGLAPSFGNLLLWAGALGIGGSTMAWHSLAWMAIIDRVGTTGLGRASGIMQLGFTLGFATGPPTVGAVIDSSSSYQLAWGLVTGLFVGVCALTAWVRGRAAKVGMTVSS